MRLHLCPGLVACFCTALLTSGCQLIVDPDRFGDDPPSGDAGGDANADATPGKDAIDSDATQLCSGFTPHIIGFEDLDLAGEALLLQANSDYRIDTDDNILYQGQTELATLQPFVQGTNSTMSLLSVGAFIMEENSTLRVQGSQPLYIAANFIVLDGTVDVSSKRAEFKPGAGGGQSVVCTTEDGTGGGGGNSAAGGGGGGFGSAGGSGQDFVSNAGRPAMSVDPDMLRGGCDGGNGGNGDAGGSGGGAIMLFACASMSIGGVIDASGAGGNGGDGGGGGGGSGGFIGYESPDLILNDPLFRVNGGGGGGGGGLGSTGFPGSDGSIGGAPGAGMNGSRGGAGAVKENHEDNPVGEDTPFDLSVNGGGGGGAGQIYGIPPVPPN